MWFAYFYWRYLDNAIAVLTRRPYLNGNKHRDWLASLVAWLLILLILGLVFGILLLPKIAAHNFRWR